MATDRTNQAATHTLPNSRTTFLPGKGHFLTLKRWGEVLAALVSDE